MAKAQNMQNAITIGELSQMTGISTHTLRVWEKRYGSPKALRLPSGHRRYLREEVPRLRAVAEALHAGFRASRVVPESLARLKTLLRSEAGSPAAPEPAEAAALDLEPWFSAIPHFDEQDLTRRFYEEWGRRGPLEFVRHCAAPFMVGVGTRWASGTLSVGQEHFASERLSDFLAAQWRRLNERNSGSPMLLCALPGDQHRVGLQMCAVVTALADRRVVYVGSNTPLEDIEEVTPRLRATALCVSISTSMQDQQPAHLLKTLRRRLPETILLVTGGGGAPPPAAGILRFTDLDDYYLWLRNPA